MYFPGNIIAGAACVSTAFDKVAVGLGKAMGMVLGPQKGIVAISQTTVHRETSIHPLPLVAQSPDIIIGLLRHVLNTVTADSPEYKYERLMRKELLGFQDRVDELFYDVDRLKSLSTYDDVEGWLDRVFEVFSALDDFKSDLFYQARSPSASRYRSEIDLILNDDIQLFLEKVFAPLVQYTPTEFEEWEALGGKLDALIDLIDRVSEKTINRRFKNWCHEFLNETLVPYRNRMRFFVL